MGLEKFTGSGNFTTQKFLFDKNCLFEYTNRTAFFYMCGIYALRAIARVISRRLMWRSEEKTWNCVKIFQWKHNPNGVFQLECFMVWMCWWFKTFKKRQQLHDKKGSWIWKKKSLQIKSMKAFRVWNMTNCCCFDRERDIVDCHCYAQATKYHRESINHITIFMITWVLWGTMNNWLITHFTIAWDMLRSRLL